MKKSTKDQNTQLRMRNVKFVMLIALIILTAFMAIRWIDHTAPAKTATYSFEREKRVMMKKFDQLGEQDAFDYFREAYKPYGDKPHLLAHWVGEELYRRLGMDGFSICDRSYNYGCFHGFIGRAIQQDGDVSFQELERNCLNDRTNEFFQGACIHGIGHGALFVEGGYEFDDLLSALRSCDQLSAEFSQTSCYNGVYMEYNERTMTATGDSLPRYRTLDSDSPYYPCDELPDVYASHCYFEQVKLWKLAFGEDIQQLIGLCARAEDASARRECSRAIGNTFRPRENFSFDEVGELCSTMPMEDMKEYCIKGVIEYFVYYQKYSDKDNTDGLCEVFESSFYGMCQTYTEDVLCQTLGECTE